MADSLATFQVKFLRGSASANDAYVGPVGELTVDLTNWRLRIHDGGTQGGHPISNMEDLQVLETTVAELTTADIGGMGAYATDTEAQNMVDAGIQLLREELDSNKARLEGDSTQDFAVKQLTAHSHILPGTPNLDIGSTTNRFRGIYVDEAYLSTNTLYIGDTPIMGTDADTILIKADADQSLTMRTTGTGITTIQSQAGVVVTSTGLNSDIQMNASGAGSKVRMGAAQSIDLTAPEVRVYGDSVIDTNQSVGGDLTVAGSLTVNGDVISVNTQTVEVSDNLMMLNHGEAGSGVTANLSGIEVDRGNLSSYQFVFNETEDLFMVGMVGDLEAVATREWTQDAFAALEHVHNVATTTTSGFMGAADKSKLDGVEAGAEKNVGDTFSVEGSYAGLRAQSTTKGDVGLGSVDNTSDADKPVSTAQQTALDTKVNFTDIVDDLTSALETGKPLSAAQGAVLKGHIDTINGLISTDDTTLDELQEVVDFIKANRTDLENLDISNIAGLQSALDTKIDKVAGKGLSTEDYTTDEKTKLNGVETGAQVNVGTNLSIAGTGNTRTVTSSTGSGATLPIVSVTNAGLMSTGDKTKLNGIEVGAEKNIGDVFDQSGVYANLRAQATTKADVGLGNVDNTSDSAKPVSIAQQAEIDKKVNIIDIVNNLTSTLVTDKPLSAAQGAVLKGHIDNIDSLLSSDNTALDSLQEIVDYVEANRSSLEALGVSNIAGLQNVLDTKVDQVSGKGLSTEDYTTAEKSKLGNVEAGAQVNVATDLTVGGAGNSRTIRSSTGTDASLPLASVSNAGLMSTADKTKLDSVESGAQANVGDIFSATGSYTGLRAQSTTQADVGLGSVRNVASYSQTEADERYVPKGVIDMGTLA